MKKLVEISPLNTSSKLAYRCESCGSEGHITLNPPVDTDYEGNPLDPSGIADIPCPDPKCNAFLT
jgi:hypothetical protein